MVEDGTNDFFSLPITAEDLNQTFRRSRWENTRELEAAESDLRLVKPAKLLAAAFSVSMTRHRPAEPPALHRPARSRLRAHLAYSQRDVLPRRFDRRDRYLAISTPRTSIRYSANTAGASIRRCGKATRPPASVTPISPCLPRGSAGPPKPGCSVTASSKRCVSRSKRAVVRSSVGAVSSSRSGQNAGNLLRDATVAMEYSRKVGGVDAPSLRTGCASWSSTVSERRHRRPPPARTRTQYSGHHDFIVVVTNIETAQHLARARILGYHQGQGFYFYRPVPAQTIEYLLIHGLNRTQASASGPIETRMPTAASA
ncbi:hypothetical protein BH23CHL2_BH23CHL2_23320 [soil metagenome]